MMIAPDIDLWAPRTIIPSVSRFTVDVMCCINELYDSPFLGGLIETAWVLGILTFARLSVFCLGPLWRLRPTTIAQGVS